MLFGDTFLMKENSPSLRLISLLAAVIAITPLAIDMYLPALPVISAQFGVPAGSAQMTLSDGHSDSVGKPLTKWAGSDFDSCCVTRLGVTRRGGTPLAKRS